MNSIPLTKRPWLPVVAAVLTLILGACARPPGPGKVGGRLEYRGYAMTVTNIETARDLPGARAARSGDTLIAVEILIESNGANVQVSPAHMWLAEPSGKVYKPHTTGRAPILQEQADLPKGQRVQGWLTFEVPDNAKNLRFVNELPKEFNHVELKVNISGLTHVMPAKAGIQNVTLRLTHWMPAFAGMTAIVSSHSRKS